MEDVTRNLEYDVMRLERKISALEGMLYRFLMNRKENEEQAYDELLEEVEDLYKI